MSLEICRGEPVSTITLADSGLSLSETEDRAGYADGTGLSSSVGLSFATVVVA
jgi:hypothetical protein